MMHSAHWSKCSKFPSAWYQEEAILSKYFCNSCSAQRWSWGYHFVAFFKKTIISFANCMQQSTYSFLLHMFLCQFLVSTLQSLWPELSNIVQILYSFFIFFVIKAKTTICKTNFMDLQVKKAL